MFMSDEKSAKDSSPSDDWSAHFVDGGRLLPTACPLCAAPGSQPRPVPFLDRKGDSDLDAMLCELCAEDIQSRATRRIGSIAAAGIFIFTAATALTLFLGNRWEGLQIVVILAFSLLSSETLGRTGLGRKSPSALSLLEGSEGDRSILICSRRRYRRVLDEEGFERAPLPERTPVERDSIGTLRASLLSLGLVVLGLIHALGGATLRVIQSGDEDAFLLVDARQSGRVAPTNSEDPTAGKFVRILGGRRHLQFVSAEGSILANETLTIWPGRTYIVGHLPPGRCLFWEKRSYGNAERSVVFPLPGSGPIWELTDRVDSWFLPLGDEEASPADEGGSVGPLGLGLLGTSGGTRRAVRLLPCRATGR